MRPDRGVAIGFDDGSGVLSDNRPCAAWHHGRSLSGGHLRGKIRVSISRYNEAKIHKAAQEELVVAEAVHDVSEGNAALKCRLALILLKAELDIFSFPFGEPFGLLRETWDDLTLLKATC